MAVLGDQRLLLVAGKGGVGKSTISAARALHCARAGRTRRSPTKSTRWSASSPLLGHGEVGAQVKQVEENLLAVDARPQESMREYGLMILKLKSCLQRRLLRTGWCATSCASSRRSRKLTWLGKALFHLQEKDDQGRWRFDRIVLDAPSTGHAVTFLSLPPVILDTVPAGPMSHEAATMRDLLIDPRVTAALLVSLPEEMPLSETLELHRAR